MKLLSRIRAQFVGRVATLAATVLFSALLSLALLPLATRILHASDYGIYALLMSVVMLASGAMDGGCGLLLPAHYGIADKSERGRIATSLVLVSAVSSGTVALLLVGLWFWWHSQFASLVIPSVVAATAAIIIPMRAVTMLSITVFSVTGRSNAIAAQMASQAVFVFVGTLVALFGFSLGGASLFIGAACGQLAALCVCLLVLWNNSEFSLPSRHWLWASLTSAPTTGASGIMDGARGFAENGMLTAASGLHAAGIYSHARLYYNLLMSFGSTLTHNILTKSLDDARDPLSDFDTTERVWSPFHVVLSFAGIGFVFLGTEIVELVSNGKLTEAASYIPALVIIAIIQTVEQPAVAIVYASGRAASAMWFRTIAICVSLAALYPSIMLFGIDGILAIGIAEAIAYRVYLRILASRKRKVRFQDWNAVFGCLMIAAALAYVHVEAPSIGLRLILMVTALALIAIAGWRSVLSIFTATRALIDPTPNAENLGGQA